MIKTEAKAKIQDELSDSEAGPEAGREAASQPNTTFQWFCNRLRCFVTVVLGQTCKTLF